MGLPPYRKLYISVADISVNDMRVKRNSPGSEWVSADCPSIGACPPGGFVLTDNSEGRGPNSQRNARAKGKRLGQPKRVVDSRRIAARRAQGAGWERIAAEMGIGVGTLYRLARKGSKTREKVF